MARPVRPSRRWRIPLIGCGVVVALLALVVGAGLYLQHRAREVPDHFPRPQPRFDDRRAAWPSRFGVNAGTVAETPDPAFRRRQFAAIAAGGLRWIRIGATWPLVQPREDGPYDWSTLDGPIGEAAAAGLDVAPAIQFTPKWASTVPGSNRALAKDPADTDRFVVALVRRFGPDGDFWREHPDLPARPIRVWEIWNEENAQHFFAPKSGKTYAYQAVLVARAIRAVDPRARVLMGGLVGRFESRPDLIPADRFLSETLDAQPSLRQLLDGVAWHAYGDAARVGRVTCQFRQVMDRLGMRGKAIVLNEFGGTRNGLGATTEAQRSALLGGAIAGLTSRHACGGSNPRIPLIAPYTWWTKEQDRDNAEDWFGLADAAGRPYPAGRTYLQAVRNVSRGD